MKCQIVCEGPTDLVILKSLLKSIGNDKIEIIQESKTQVKYRGHDSITNNYKIFSKMLHNGFSKGVDAIIICVDNDYHMLDNNGLGIERKKIIIDLYKRFIKDNKSQYSTIITNITVVPVETIDYWMMSLNFSQLNCNKIRDVEKIGKNEIKKKTYGEKNVYLGWMIDQDALSSQLLKISDTESIEKMECLPSFMDFKKQIKRILATIPNAD